MGLGPFIVIMKELKAHVFNAKGKREILNGYWRSLPSNLLGNLSVHLLWSWKKEIGVPHARAHSPCRAEAEAVGVGVTSGRMDGRDVLWGGSMFLLLMTP
jgi:hypothetical protein